MEHNPALHLGNLEGAEQKDKIPEERNHLQVLQLEPVTEELLQGHSERIRIWKREEPNECKSLLEKP